MRLVDKNPEQALWFAVLVQAVQDLNDSAHKASAERWIMSDSTRPFGFLWICDMFEINPFKFRLHSKTREMQKAMGMAQRLLNRSHEDGENEEYRGGRSKEKVAA